MTECYRYAVDTYAQMTEDEKAKISLELLYNAICYYHGEAEEIVQELLRMDQETLSKFEASLAATRQQVKKDASGCIGCNVCPATVSICIWRCRGYPLLSHRQQFAH